jgi:hypothetical protein
MTNEKDPENIWLLESKQSAKTFADKRLAPRQAEMNSCDIRGFYNAKLGIPYVSPGVRTINVLIHGTVQEWTAYPPANEDPDTLTVKNHHDYASDVSLIFNVKTKELVDFRKNHFLSEAKWID